MVRLNWVLAAAVAAESIVTIIDELPPFTNLLKRQEPGSPAYNCHQACGQAILAARASKDVCSDDDFLTNYDTCLKCSGPDNIDIWKIYGKTLSGFAESCGLSTTPVSGGSGSATSTSTISAGSMTSLSVISTSTTPTALPTTAGETSATPTVPTPTTNGTAVTTGVVPVNAADALSTNVFGLYYTAVAFGILYAIAYY